MIKRLFSDLIITPKAIKQLQTINSPLRISVDSGGCHGFQYKIEIPKEITPEDVIFSNQGTRVVVDKISLEYIKGSTLDYSQELIGFKGVSKVPILVGIESPTCHLKSLKGLAMRITDKFIDAKEDHLEQRIWVRFWIEMLNFIKIFKKFRKETLKENLSSTQFRKYEVSKEDIGDTKIHLDDYNSTDEINEWDFTSQETRGDGIFPSHDLDELLIQISYKFTKKGFIHPAVGSPDQEKAYIRLLIDQVFYRFGWKDRKGNKLSRLLIRELVGCYGVWTWINKWSQPEKLNNFILDKAIKRFIAQASVKTFRSQLQAHFTQFPPKFLRKANQKNVAVSLASKYRYFEGLSKYAKKTKCLIDLKAVHHQILLEIRSRLQEANELINKKSDTLETLKKYLKALDAVKIKFEKRIAILAMEDEKIVLDKKRSLKNKYRPLLSLRSLLEEYLAVDEQIGSESSSRLFHYLEFMEKEGGISMIRFWIAASKLRKLYSQWILPTSLANSEPLQEEIQKLYKAYSASTFFGLNDALKAIEIFSLTQLPENLAEACLAVFKCQAIVFDELQLSFNQFLDSDHYFKLATELLKIEGSADTFLPSNSNLDTKEGALPSEKSIILTQLEVGLVRESLRLTGSKSHKDKEVWDPVDSVLFNAIEDVLDLDALGGENVLDEDDGVPFSGLDIQNSELLLNSTKLQQIKEDLDRNQQQLDILNILLQKCQSLASNPPTPAQIMQIHILEQSQILIRQEINDLNIEKMKYQTQEQKEAIIPGFCIVRIIRATEAIRDQKKVTFYEIDVNKDSGARRWAVQRRYNEFLLLHKKLKEKFPIVHEFDLPGKNFSIFHSKVGKEELKRARMSALEKYLQRLIDNPLICQSDELRSFLSSAEYKRNQYNTVESIIEISDGANYNLKSGAQKIAKFVGSAKRRLHLGKEDVKNDTKSTSALEANPLFNDDETSDDPDGDWGLSNEEQTDEENSSSLGYLSDPLCSVLVELFDLKEQDYYLKKSASAVLLKQYFGGRMSLESEIAEMLSNYMTEDVFCKLLNRTNIDRLMNFSEANKSQSLKSDENLKPSSSENISRSEIKSKLFSVWPDVFSRSLGPECTQVGVGRILDLMQSSTLNKHIMFTLLDSIIEAILEE